MAHVFLARDKQHDRWVALKVLKPDLASSVGPDRFLREIKIEAKLQHPHILPLYDSGRADGLLYYTMPYVQGETLRDRLVRDQQLPVEDVVDIARDVAEAIEYANGQGVVHRDIKPENILLSGGHALVADFGIARAVSQAGGENLTTEGVVVGTPAYMSPEQATGVERIDGRSDIYTLGLVVYEMLTGEPPFTGATPGAVLARQASERVPSIEVVRPNIPHAMTMAVEKALAKVPADRYQSAVAFVADLERSATGETGEIPPPPPPARRWRVVVAGVVAAVAAAVLAWQVFVSSSVGLDENVIVMFPLEWSNGGAGDNGHSDGNPLLGEEAAFLIVAWLDGWGSFTWVAGWELLEDRRRDSVRLLKAREKSAIALAQRAAYYVDGRAIRVNSDSVRIALALHYTRRERPFARADTVGSVSEAAQLGVIAAGRLMLSLLPSGETVDMSDVTGVTPQAVQTMVQAEREFHSGRFSSALELYRAAVERDSTFALAGARGAQAASWKHRQSEALDLIHVAVANLEQLAPRWAQFALGFQAYLEARGDSAVHYFEEAIPLSGNWAEGWMGLAETYQHLLPRRSPPDSLARAGFEEVYRRKPGYVPALYHLSEFALRDGDLDRASELLDEYRAAEPERDVLAVPVLALDCLRRSPGAVDWRRHVLEDPDRVYQAAKILGVGGAAPDCAEAGWRAVLAYDTATSENYRFGSLVALQSLLVATGRTADLKLLLDSAAATGSLSGTTGKLDYILDAVAGADVDAEGKAVADSLRRLLPELSETRLWFLAIWDIDNDLLDEATRIRDRLDSLAQTGSRRAGLMVAALTAHLTLAAADTTGALELLESLAPNSPRSSYMNPWESLGLERITLATILFAEGEYERAYNVATVFDSPSAASVIYPVFLRESLELRLEAAREMGWGEKVEELERRLDQLT